MLMRLEPRAGRPAVERPHRARLPHRNLVALAELAGRVAVELERVGQRGAVVGSHRAVAGRRGGHVRDGPHPGGVMVAPRQKRLATGGAQRGRVEAVELQLVCREPLGDGCVARAAERAGRREAHVIEQDDEHVRCALRRPTRLDGRKPGVGILGVVGRQADVAPLGDRQGRARVDVIGALLARLSAFSQRGGTPT